WYGCSMVGILAVGAGATRGCLGMFVEAREEQQGATKRLLRVGNNSRMPGNAPRGSGRTLGCQETLLEAREELGRDRKRSERQRKQHGSQGRQERRGRR